MMTDEEIDALIDGKQGSVPEYHDEAPMQARVAAEHPQQMPQQQTPQIPVYPLDLAQAPPTGASEPIMKRRIVGVPVWAWGLIAAGVGGTGYLFYRNRKQASEQKKNTDTDTKAKVEANEMPELPASTGSTSGSWSPSRSRVADQLNRYFQRKGASDKVIVWHDADEAKERGKLKHVSPLVNLQLKGDFKIDKDFERYCRREGLNPVQHQDKSVGLYPTESKRGKEWEGYIDALRDDGQKV